MPSQNPMAAGRKAHWPRDADWFMEGMRRLHMEAAVMTPAAKPVRARRRLVRRVPFIRKTQAEPKVVPRKGRRMPCRMFAVMGREVLSFLLVWVGFAEMHYIMRGRDRSSRPPEAFPYPVFGRFAYRVSALYGHCLCNWDGDGLVLRLCPSISDTLYANSRTPDIGKARERLSPQPV